MLKNKAIYYYNSGYNCSQSIILAASDIYRLNISKDAIKLSHGISTGFGTGGICCVAVACIMILSYMFPENMPRLRIEFLDRFQNILGNINCSKIRKDSCSNIIAESCKILEDLIKNNS